MADKGVAWPGVVCGVVAGFVLGRVYPAFVRRIRRNSGYLGSEFGSEVSSDEIISENNAPMEDYKLVLCVRTDLKMTKGKIAAQVGHAVLGAYKRASRRDPLAVRQWEANCQPKIAVQIKSYSAAQQLERDAKKAGLPTYMVHDSGRTQIPAGSMTVLAVGPGPVGIVNMVTGNLKLL